MFMHASLCAYLSAYLLTHVFGVSTRHTHTDVCLEVAGYSFILGFHHHSLIHHRPCLPGGGGRAPSSDRSLHPGCNHPRNSLPNFACTESSSQTHDVLETVTSPPCCLRLASALEWCGPGRPPLIGCRKAGTALGSLPGICQ